MIEAYERKGLYMVIGVFKEGRLNTDISQVIAPYLSGQRVLNRDVWERVRKNEGMDFGVEMALTKLALKEGWEEERAGGAQRCDPRDEGGKTGLPSGAGGPVEDVWRHPPLGLHQGQLRRLTI
ncbi:MAG: hypothetical protein GWO44_18995 [Thermoplasmata archaeon]|nr:hypothetical protein [Thermoplasmata archaeon]NIY05287.1 hypothetical protein [Thermoplasmata archaeon]